MPLSRNFKLTLAYDGSAFAGWQYQVGVRTVQGVLEEALGKVLGDPVRVMAAGRTDAGVHALGQVVGVRSTSPIPVSALARALNGCLPADVSVLDAAIVSDDFHARYSAKMKQYAYVLDTSGVRNPLLARYCLSVQTQLDVTAMQRAAQMLLGEHDFAAFMAAGSAVKTTERRVMTSEIVSHGARLYYVIEGSGFLRHMVRNIVGTLLMVGRGAVAPGAMAHILSGRDRAAAGPTAEPQGLYLVKVMYDEV